jgi:hypothetical protein
MVACVVRDRTSDDELGTRFRPSSRGEASALVVPGPFEDEIAIDFPAVSSLTARICDALAREDERTSRP